MSDEGGPRPASGGWRIVIVLALLGALLGFGWGIADQPSWRATATVVVASDSGGSDEARLGRFAQRAQSQEVATRAAGLLGNDVPGADLLADVTVRPAARGGYLIVSATADAPDVAAAAAGGFQRAIVDVEGDPLQLGRAASIPADPATDRSPVLWAALGFLAGLLLGLVVTAVSSRSRRGSPRMAAAAAAPAASANGDSAADLARRLGMVLTGFDPGRAGPVRGEGGVAGIPAAAVAEVGVLADRAGVRSAGGPRSVAITTVGDGADAAGVAAALAIAAAGSGRRVLVVDADLGAPGLADRLGVDPAPGLGDHLTGSAAPKQVLRSLALEPSGGRTVAFIPSGSGVPEEGLGGAGFGALAARLERAYELVVYAAPPITGSGDAVVASAEAVVVLIGPGAGPSELSAAAHQLADVPVRVVAAYGR